MIKSLKTTMAVALAGCFMFAAPAVMAGAAPSGIKSKKEISKAAKAAVSHISATELKAKIEANDKFFLIDSRTMPEFQAGHIEGAMWIPRGWIEFKTPKKIKDANAEIVVYCKAGSRGSLATKALLDMGYKNVRDLDGGIKGWINEDLPLYGILGKIEVLDVKAKEKSPNGSGLVRNVYP